MNDTQTALAEVPVEGTDKSIAISRPDQGTRIVQAIFDRPNMGINVWEGESGHDVESFVKRWGEFIADETQEFFAFIDVRYGEVGYLTRAAIGKLIIVMDQYHRAEDARAQMVLAAVPAGPGGVPILRR